MGLRQSWSLGLALACTNAPPALVLDEPCREATLGPAGGVMRVGNNALVVPLAALPTPQTLTWCATGSHRWELGPPGIVFERAATVVLEHDWTEPSGLFVPGTEGERLELRARAPTPQSWIGEVNRTGTITIQPSSVVSEPYGSQPVFSHDVDVLWVLDNSCSFEQDTAVFGAYALMDHLQAGGLRYHMGVTSTDLDGISGDEGCCGRLREVEGLRWVEDTTADARRIFETMAQMGTSGSGSERGLGAAYAAIAKDGGGFNAGFVRPDAHLAVIVVTDEGNQTVDPDPSEEAFIAWLQNLREGPHAALYAAGQDRSSDYFRVAEETGGAWFEGGERVTDPAGEDWSPILSPLLTAIAQPVAHAIPDRATEVEVWWAPSGQEPVPRPEAQVQGRRVWAGPDAPDDLFVTYVRP